MEDLYELNTSDPPTVEQVIAFLKQHPMECTVRGYEGEGGSWIIVDKAERVAASTS